MTDYHSSNYLLPNVITLGHFNLAFIGVNVSFHHFFAYKAFLKVNIHRLPILEIAKAETFVSHLI